MDDAQAAKLRELAERAISKHERLPYLHTKDGHAILALLDERDDTRSKERRALREAFDAVRERDAAQALLREARGVIALMRDWHDPASSAAKVMLARIDAMLGDGGGK